jgi:hypothetical protein
MIRSISATNGNSPVSFNIQDKPKELNKEQVKNDSLLALVTIVYLLLMLVLFSWQLFDTWMGRHSILTWFGYAVTRLNTPTFRLVIYTVLGGALGGVVNGIRSFLVNYHEFSGRYVWKYITAPWMGATLAFFVYGLIHSGTAVFDGGGANDIRSTQALANFAAGALAGYGAKDVFIWLDAQVENLFKVQQHVPDVTGQSEADAAATLHAHELAVGDVTQVPQENEKRAGTVIDQVPAPKETIARGDEVDVAVATNATGEEGGRSSVTY